MPVLARIRPFELDAEGHPRAFTLTSPGRRVAATVVPALGGVLSSLLLDGYGELLYRAADFGQPEPGEWTGRAPVLWPVVGRTYPLVPTADTDPASLRLGWRNSDGAWPMPIHGFARSLPWKMTSMSANYEVATLDVELTDSAESRRFYPHAFELRATWTVDDYGVEQAVRIYSREALRFGLGNHLTLAVRDEAAFDSITLRTSSDARLAVNRFGLLDETKITVGARDGVPLSEPWTCNGALIGGRDGWVEVRQAAGPIVRVSHTVTDSLSLGRPEDHLFVLYGRRDRGFYCPEPWLGRPNGLQTGKGCVNLPRATPFGWKMRIDLEGL
ncbi:MAG: hypothetical protein HZB16_13170 [Armatimonadetes bacterium]|nr:hypothetical protein [Armatimonadota bacterium]